MKIVGDKQKMLDMIDIRKRELLAEIKSAKADIAKLEKRERTEDIEYDIRTKKLVISAAEDELIFYSADFAPVRLYDVVINFKQLMKFKEQAQPHEVNIYKSAWNTIIVAWKENGDEMECVLSDLTEYYKHISHIPELILEDEAKGECCMKVSIVLNGHQLYLEHNDTHLAKGIIDDFYRAASTFPAFNTYTTLENVDESTPAVIKKEVKATKKSAEKAYDPTFVKSTPWREGIQIENGKPRYQAFYWCNCGKQAKRFIDKETRTVSCDQCSAVIMVEPATTEVQDNGLPVRDQWGNFFVAKESIASLM